MKPAEAIHLHWVRGVYYEAGTQEDLIFLLEKVVESKDTLIINYMDSNYRDILEIDRAWFTVSDDPRFPVIMMVKTASRPMCISTARIGMLRSIDGKTTLYRDPMYLPPTKQQIIEATLPMSPSRRMVWCAELGIDPSILVTE